jgi:hypothetical protein
MCTHIFQGKKLQLQSFLLLKDALKGNCAHGNWNALCPKNAETSI